MAWDFHSARKAFHHYRGLWDKINQIHGNPILLDGDFVEILIRHFASDEVLLAVDEGALSAILVTQNRKTIWQTFQPSQAPLGLILLGTDEDAASQISALTRALPGYALLLGIMRQDPAVTQLGNVANGSMVERVDYILTSRLDISGNFQDYWKTRSRNLIHNLSRQRRRLNEQHARLELVVDRQRECMAEGVRIYGQLESAGWKGREGSAVAAENAQGLFYRDLLETFAARNESVIYRLDLNGAPIASSLCLERSGKLMVLKIAYDEEIKGLSPGLLLHEEMLKDIFSSNRIQTIEYYGRYTGWHQKWTDQTRVMYHLNIHRHAWVQTAKRYFSKAVGSGNGHYTAIEKRVI